MGLGDKILIFCLWVLCMDYITQGIFLLEPCPTCPAPATLIKNSLHSTPRLLLLVCSRENKRKHLSDNTLESVLEPLDGLGLVDAVRSTNLGLATAATSDTLTGALPEMAISTDGRGSRGRSVTYMQQ